MEYVLSLIVALLSIPLIAFYINYVEYKHTCKSIAKEYAALQANLKIKHQQFKDKYQKKTNQVNIIKED